MVVLSTVIGCWRRKGWCGQAEHKGILEVALGIGLERGVGSDVG